MKRFLAFVLVLVVAIGAMGYWRGWFNVSKEPGKLEVHVDQDKFNQDKETFNKTVREKTQAFKDQVANLWTKSEGLTGDDKARAQKELGELKQKHERLEQQLKELESAGQDKYVTLKQDLSKSLEEVEVKIEEWRKKLEKEKGK